MILICIFVLIALGSQLVKKKNLIIYGFICALVLASISFYIDIIPESDLFRHIEQIRLFKSQGLHWIIKTGKFQKNPGTQLTFWILSFLEDYRYVPGIICFVAYGLMYNLIIKIYLDFNYSKKWLLFTMLFANICFNYYLLIYAVRMWLVFIIFAYCMYEECILERRKLLCWIVYIFLIFYHYASLILIIGRVINIFLHPTNNKIELLKRFVAVLIIILSMIYIWNNYIGVVVTKKIVSYESYNVRGKWQILNAVIRILGVLSIVLYQKFKRYRKKLACYYNILIYIIFIIFLKFDNYQIILRFTDCLIVICLAILPDSNKMVSKKNFTLTVSQIIMILMMVSSICYYLLFDFRHLHFIF